MQRRQPNGVDLYGVQARFTDAAIVSRQLARKRCVGSDIDSQVRTPGQCPRQVASIAAAPQRLAIFTTTKEAVEGDFV
jgi:hypothetical protein